jgi:hypothetical protein
MREGVRAPLRLTFDCFLLRILTSVWRNFSDGKLQCLSRFIVLKISSCCRCWGRAVVLAKKYLRLHRPVKPQLYFLQALPKNMAAVAQFSTLIY